jgi:hypothetical protein
MGVTKRNGVKIMTPAQFKAHKDSIASALRSGDVSGALSAFWAAADVMTDAQASAMMQMIAADA